MAPPRACAGARCPWASASRVCDRGDAHVAGEAAHEEDVQPLGRLPIVEGHARLLQRASRGAGLSGRTRLARATCRRWCRASRSRARRSACRAREPRATMGFARSASGRPAEQVAGAHHLAREDELVEIEVLARAPRPSHPGARGTPRRRCRAWPSRSPRHPWRPRGVLISCATSFSNPARAYSSSRGGFTPGARGGRGGRNSPSCAAATSSNSMPRRRAISSATCLT